MQQRHWIIAAAAVAALVLIGIVAMPDDDAPSTASVPATAPAPAASPVQPRTPPTTPPATTR
jgi:Flp pilus assembly protein CpaB